MERDNGDSAGKFDCTICVKAFRTATILRIHRRIHVAEKKYRCEECDMRFHQKINLKYHLNVHSNKQPYRCDLCTKGYNQPSNLRVHRKTCAQKWPIHDFDVIKMAPIKSPALAGAQKNNRIPFVGVFFVDGSAKLYRAYNQDDYCLLRPINSEDLRKTCQRCCDGMNMTISTVASVRQQILYDGNGSPPINEFVLVDSGENHDFVTTE